MYLCPTVSEETGTRLITVLNWVLSLLILTVGILGCVVGVQMIERAAKEKNIILNSKLSPQQIGGAGIIVMCVSVMLSYLGLICLLISVFRGVTDDDSKTR